MSASLLAQVLRPGDRIVVGQATSEPAELVDDLFAAAAYIDNLEAFCGFSLNRAWAGPLPDALLITTYCGLGAMGALTRRGRARVIPFAMSQLSAALAARTLPVDVVLLQVSPADADGFHSLGFAADYVWEAAQRARVVVAQVNAQVPVTHSSCRLHAGRLVIAGECDTPLPESPREPVGDLQSRIAKEVASLVPDGATVQIGIGRLSEAVALALREHRGLKIRSGTVGDWFPDLLDAGAIDTDTPDACLASLAVGSAAFYDYARGSARLGFALPEHLVVPLPGSAFMLIISGIEVDLHGQVNAEFLGGRYVGACSGQPDYFRAARRSAGGLAIVALPSANERGDVSRIVPGIAQGHVTTAQSDVDIIVTEHGIADIRATDLDERRRRIAAIADPRQRGVLLKPS